MKKKICRGALLMVVSLKCCGEGMGLKVQSYSTWEQINDSNGWKATIKKDWVEISDYERDKDKEELLQYLNWCVAQAGPDVKSVSTVPMQTLVWIGASLLHDSTMATEVLEVLNLVDQEQRLALQVKHGLQDSQDVLKSKLSRLKEQFVRCVTFI